MKKPYNPQMTVVKSPETPKEGEAKTEAPLSHEELMAALRTKGTVMEREQAVIENLRRQGLVP